MISKRMTESGGSDSMMNNLSNPRDTIKENVARTRRLRRALEDWRELLAPLHGVLVWRHEYHPPLLAAVVTLIFLVVWYLEPPLLTLVAVLGVTATTADYLVPALCQALFRPQDWTASNEREFERMCELLADISTSMECCWFQLSGWKQEKPKLYFIGMVGVLLLLAWLGNNINNLFLAYLLAQWIVMYPGLRQRGLIKSTWLRRFCS
ncbi:ADP-ribosylation factor-like protein 6-interacting protein 1 [Amphibalanus amphitrite]|uniref:ADP-ribosylation factor-like protein 6-interacting protein 1 n=1 Tax=Amphibalanus amphitrite TaxID=1232801 RepID=A0A6A4VMQ8_AMPAM|nr:ADP-ribosylation factor-like protein 6-interacting protein 1 [Amphibalanus amphitrite]